MFLYLIKEKINMIENFLIHSPLEQFELITIIPLTFFGLNFSLVNSSFFLILTLSFLFF